jgi:beta-hydroxylase
MDHYFEQLDVNSNIESFLEKTKPNCDFTGGFRKLENNDTSLNKKHTLGRNLIMLLSISIMSLVIGLIDGTKTPIQQSLIITSVVFFLMFIIIVTNNPINIIYIPSYVISEYEKTPPYLDKSKYFPEYKKFEDPETFKQIKKEMMYIHSKRDNLPFTRDTFDDQNKQIGSDDSNDGGWKIYMIMAGKTFNKESEELCPVLTSLLKNTPSIKSCLFSILDGDKEIPIHYGYYKGLLRYHLALKIPDPDPFICVNGGRYSWKEGEGVVFDDTFAHKVYNTSKDTRVIIYMDIERKIENKLLSAFNHKFLDFVLSSKAVKDEVKKTEVQI